MSVFINEELIDVDDQTVSQGEPAFCDDTSEVERISRHIKFDWQRPRPKMTGESDTLHSVRSLD